MKKFALSLTLLIFAPLAWGTAYTSVATGNWNNSATWSPAAIPGSGDTVTLANGYTVTVPVSYTATVSGISCSSATGTGILIVNGTLDYKDTVNQCSANPWICNSCTLQADSASTNIAWNIGYASCTSSPCAVLQLNGTSSSPYTVKVASGSLNSGGFGNGTYQDSGTVQATWGSFTNCGTSSIPCIDVYSYYYVGLQSSFTYTTFTSSGVVELGSVQLGNGTSFIWNNNGIVTPLNDISFIINAPGGDSTFTCQIENNYFEGEVNEISSPFGADDGCIENRNVFT